MALSYFTESEAPRDFRVSSTESDGHYKKCLLCYTVKRNFYCAECIRTGNFVHSSMPYSDRYSEKQAKLLRVKANRKHILDRCERLLAAKLKKDTLLTEAKQSRDKLELLRLAIEQRRRNIEEKRKELNEINNCNNELRLKLPRYQKRVSSLGKHAELQSLELQNKVCTYNEQAEALAALRRARIRQLIKYIFPVYISYDMSDSIEDMEFIGEDIEEEPQKRSQLHIVAPWIDADGDLTHVHSWNRESRDALCASVGAGGGAGAGAGAGAAGRAAAALALAAQLAALLGWTLDLRLPHALPLSEYSTWVVPPAPPPAPSSGRTRWWRCTRWPSPLLLTIPCWAGCSRGRARQWWPPTRRGAMCGRRPANPTRSPTTSPRSTCTGPTRKPTPSNCGSLPVSPPLPPRPPPPS